MSFFEFLPDNPVAFTIWASVVSVQGILFISIWIALHHEKRLSLRLRRKDVHYPKLKRAMLKLSAPRGGIFPIIGILGTFIGLAINVENMNDYVQAIQDATSDPGNVEYLDIRDSNLRGILGGVFISLSSTIIGIIFYFSSKLIWPTCSIEELDFSELDEIINACHSRLGKKLTREAKKSGLFIDTIRIVLEEMSHRTHTPYSQVNQKVSEFADAVNAMLIIHDNREELENYSSGKFQFDVSPEQLDEQMIRLRATLNAANQNL